jgi:DedD protein
VEERVKKRLVGAVVLVALAVIFVPFFLEKKGEQPQSAVDLQENIPPQPPQTFREGLVPDEKSAAEQVLKLERDTGGFNISERLELEEYVPPAEIVDAPAAAESGDKRRESDDTPSPPVASAQQGKSGKPQKTAAAQQPAPRTGWIIQAGSFGQKSNADKLQQGISNSGASAYIEEIDVQGKTLYRVRLGPFPSKSSAQQQLEVVEKQFDLKGRVINMK